MNQCTTCLRVKSFGKPSSHLGWKESHLFVFQPESYCRKTWRQLHSTWPISNLSVRSFLTLESHRLSASPLHPSSSFLSPGEWDPFLFTLLMFSLGLKQCTSHMKATILHTYMPIYFPIVQCINIYQSYLFICETPEIISCTSIFILCSMHFTTENAAFVGERQILAKLLDLDWKSLT